MSEWRVIPLDRIVGLRRGFDLPEQERHPGPFPVLGSSGISGWHDVASIEGPGVTVGRSGASIGVASYFDGPCWPLNTTLFVEDFKDNDPLFVYYLLHSMDFSGFNSGSAQPSLNRNYIADIRVPVPGRPEQQRIAQLLGALDDKIAVNYRTAQSCHQLAELHYRDYSSGKPAIALSALVTPILGGTPDRASTEYWGGTNLWASAKDVAGCDLGTLLATDEKITDLAIERTKAKPVATGSVIMTARGTLGAVARVCQPTSLNQSCYAFTPGTLPPGVLYFTVLSAAEQLTSMAQGTVFSTVNMRTFEHIRVAAVAGDLLQPLEGRLRDFLNAVEIKLRENRALAALRDTLLPRLISGEVRVREAEKMIGDAT